MLNLDQEWDLLSLQQLFVLPIKWSDGGNIAAVIIFTHADNLLFILSASNGSLCSLLSNLMISLSVSPNTLDKLQRINFRTKMQFLYE